MERLPWALHWDVKQYLTPHVIVWDIVERKVSMNTTKFSLSSFSVPQSKAETQTFKTEAPVLLLLPNSHMRTQSNKIYAKVFPSSCWTFFSDSASNSLLNHILNENDLMREATVTHVAFVYSDIYNFWCVQIPCVVIAVDKLITASACLTLEE